MKQIGPFHVPYSRREIAFTVGGTLTGMAITLSNHLLTMINGGCP